MNMLVSTAIVGASTNAPAALQPDPVLAAIEAHRTAVIATRAAFDLHCALDHELPVDKCRSSFTAWEETIVPTDDPRWIDAERGLQLAHEAEADAACVVVGATPTTLAGVVALLQYAVAADVDGEGWPSDLQSDDGMRTRTWQQFLIEMLADAMPGMVQA